MEKSPNLEKPSDFLQIGKKEKMKSKEPEELNNTETDEGTIAIQKKRSRRVSFAENTSIHVFDRDDDFETPPDPKPSSSGVNSDGGSREAEDEVAEFLRECNNANNGDGADDNTGGNEEEGEDVEVMDGRKSFFRSMDSPSPGSTIGSAMSNDVDDEDNFFGPVSASFIRPGRYSDTTASEDDHHDLTMDSTAFSMHFRSLARSESGGDLKTPTGIANLAFEQKTPTPVTTPCKLESLMVLTGDKKPILQFPVLLEKDSGSLSRDSNDMSLVGENPHRYDYAKLSPRLDALLAGGCKDFPSDAVFVSPSRSLSSPNKESEVSRVGINSNGLMGLKDSADVEPVNHGTHDRSAEEAPVAHTEASNANTYDTNIPTDEITHSPNDGPVVDASLVNQAQSPNHLNTGIQLDQSKESIEDSFETSGSKAKFSDNNSGNLPYMHNRVNQLNFSTKDKSRHLHSTGGWLEEDSLRELRTNNLIHHDYDQRHQSPLAESESSLSAKQRHENSPRRGLRDSDADKNFGQKYQSPLAGSISSLSAKQRQVFLGCAKSLGHTRISPEKWPGSFLSQESRRHSKSMSSIQKNISKLNILRNSPYISTLQDRNDNSRHRLLGSLSVPFFDTNSKYSKTKHVDVPIARLEEQFLRMDQKKIEHGSATNLDRNGIESETPKIIENLILTEETTDKFKKSEAATVASSPSTLSGMKVPQLLLASENFTGGTQVTSETESSLLDTTLQQGKDKKATASPEYFVSSQIKRLKKSSASPEHKRNLASDLKQQNESNELASIVPEEDEDYMETVASGSQLSAIAQKKDLFFAERIAHSHSPLNAINNCKDTAQMDRIDFGEIFHQNLSKDAESCMDLQTPLRKIESSNFLSVTPGENCQIGTDAAKFQIKLSGGEKIFSSSSSASTYLSRSSNDPFPKKSPSRKNSCNVSRSDNEYPSIDNASGRKRQREELVLRDGDHVDEIARTEKSPKVQKGGSNNTMILLEQSNENNDERMTIGGDSSLKHWSDIFSKFSAELEALHSPLIDKLNLRGIRVLEDILVHMQKVKTFEMLSADVQAQKTSDHSSNIRHKRASETRSLVCRMIYERAKLQLLRMRRERLQKRVGVLRYGTQESQILKKNFFQDQSVPSAIDAQVDNSRHQSLTVHFAGEHVVANDKVITMKQEAEASDRKINHLTESFHTSLKVKRELSSADTVVLVNDHLKKRTCCRFIRQDLQLCEVDDFESRNGHYGVVLNYQGFLFQRFTLGVPVASIIVSNKLNDATIVKKFPNIDACTAFAFVIKADNNTKYVGRRSIAQETQMTSSLLCNLLDVIEEVCLARVELSNLTDTRFHSPSAERLDLQLHFTDLKSGENIVLTLDMTCLNCGVYPSEILPSQFQAPGARTQTSPSQSLLAEVRAAVEGLRVGYSRIIRLCRCVSQILQVSSR